MRHHSTATNLLECTHDWFVGLSNSNKNVLVTGGLGYIGCHIVVKLVESNYTVSILDNLSNSDIKVLDILENMLKVKIIFYNIDVQDSESLDKLFKENNYDSVIHLAGKKSVSESINDPILYYKNNVVGSLNIIEMSMKYKVSKFIFSSSASVYGDDIKICKEDILKLNPISPYAITKLNIENILKDYSKQK